MRCFDLAEILTCLDVYGGVDEKREVREGEMSSREPRTRRLGFISLGPTQNQNLTATPFRSTTMPFSSSVGHLHLYEPYKVSESVDILTLSSCITSIEASHRKELDLQHAPHEAPCAQ